MSWFSSFFPLRWPFGGSTTHIPTRGPYCCCVGEVAMGIGDVGDPPDTEDGLPGGLAGEVFSHLIDGDLIACGSVAGLAADHGAVVGLVTTIVDAGQIGCCEGDDA